MFKGGVSLIVLLGLVPAACGQKAASGGTVSGSVFCADTNAPARLATVVLRPTTVPKHVAGEGPGPGVKVRTVQTLLDGSFSIPQVAPGTYYVMASMPGYVSPLAKLGVKPDDLLNPGDDLRKSLLEVVPTVTVQGNAGASVNISLERGAAVSGTILFDDGSPAPGVGVRLLTRKKNKWVPIETGSPNGMGAGKDTDDHGYYRLSGFPGAEECLIEVTLSAGSSTSYLTANGMSVSSDDNFSLLFYSGGVFRAGKAKPFALKLGEDRSGEDIMLPLAKLHKVQGAVTAQKDGHVLNQASLELLFADDKSEIGKTALNKDSSFSFGFVPEGDYLLRVNDASDVQIDETPNAPGMFPPTHESIKVLHDYAPAEIPIHVEGDLLELTVAVPDKPAASIAPAH
jgi:hypothetical protein